MEITMNAGISAQAGLTMKDLLLQTVIDLPKPGAVLEGEILSVNKQTVMIDLESLGTGIVYPGEFYDNSTLQKALQAGQRVSTVFLAIEDEGGLGYRELSLRRAQRTTAWEDIKQKKESGEIVTTKIVNINKGGLIVEINGVQGFLPLSQLAPDHYPKVEGGDTTRIVQALQKFRNQDFQMKIIDFSEEENRLIVSEKAITEANLQEELAKFSLGSVVDGVITDVTDFGAFVMIKPATESTTRQIEGLIHISEIDWKIIDNPRQVLASGQEVKAKIISIEGGKISLSLKALQPDPWEHAMDKYSVGQRQSGKVVKITNYGALVSLEDEITGLVPLSEFGDKKPSEVLSIGSIHSVSIVSLDPKEHKMLLTIEVNS